MIVSRSNILALVLKQILSSVQKKTVMQDFPAKTHHISLYHTALHEKILPKILPKTLPKNNSWYILEMRTHNLSP